MNFYLSKYGLYDSFIKATPESNLGIIVVIPCYNETELVKSLEAIYNCELPKKSVEVITVINNSETASTEIQLLNQKTFQEAVIWSNENSSAQLKFHFILKQDLPTKHAGVGLARKIGMDEAVRRFDLLQRDGIIVCFDADSLCDINYLVAIEDHFNSHPKSTGCSIYFEHPTHGNEFDKIVYDGIVQYELHLRYYNQALRFCNLPYAYHTVGSSMAVKSFAYQMQGGMNKRKAGEDFYFLHKIIALGNFSEINNTRVIPSPRISDRVPFGTGKAIGDYVAAHSSIYHTYNFQSFVLIKKWLTLLNTWYQNKDFNAVLSHLTQDEKNYLGKFLRQENFEKAFIEIQQNSSNVESFIKRFYRWFDAFKLLKLVHLLRDEAYPNVSVIGACHELIPSLKEKNKAIDLLHEFRKLERTTNL